MSRAAVWKSSVPIWCPRGPIRCPPGTRQTPTFAGVSYHWLCIVAALSVETLQGAPHRLSRRTPDTETWWSYECSSTVHLHVRVRRIERSYRLMQDPGSNVGVALSHLNCRVSQQALGFEERPAQHRELRRAGVPKRMPADLSQARSATRAVERSFRHVMGQGGAIVSAEYEFVKRRKRQKRVANGRGDRDDTLTVCLWGTRYAAHN